METFLRDLRYGVRTLVRKPGFTIVAVVALALGIGANSAIFSIVNAVVLRPLPYKDPERLVTAVSVNPLSPQRESAGVSPADFWDWKDQSQSFEELAALSGGGGFDLRDADPPDMFNGARVSFNFFQTFGVQPLLGRSFTQEDAQLNAPDAVVLSYRLWMRRFGGDASVVGKTYRTYEGGTTVTELCRRTSSFRATPKCGHLSRAAPARCGTAPIATSALLEEYNPTSPSRARKPS